MNDLVIIIIVCFCALCGAYNGERLDKFLNDNED